MSWVKSNRVDRYTRMADERDKRVKGERPAVPETSPKADAANPWARHGPFDWSRGKPPATAAASAPSSVPSSGRSADAEVADLVARMKSMPSPVTAGRGRLIFAMDATMSRQPTWDLALTLQADMFEAVKQVGSLDVQLVYFRGHRECRASKWVSDPATLSRLMTSVECHGGLTQIGRVLTHARSEAAESRVHAMVYVGDCMEEEVDALCGKAGELALLGTPVFLFQEGHDARASPAFAEIARITRGAHCRFDAGSARQLRDLLTAVAVYAAGGHKALEVLTLRGQGGARLLLEQLRR